MLLNSIGYQPQRAQIQNKNISFGNQTLQLPLLKSLNKDTVSFSGLSPSQKELLAKGLLPNVDYLAGTQSIVELKAMVENLTKRLIKAPYNRSLKAELRDAEAALAKVLQVSSGK